MKTILCLAALSLGIARAGEPPTPVPVLNEVQWAILQDGVTYGDWDAWVAMGDQLVYGPEDRRNIPAGMEWWARAALKNHPAALCRLAFAFESGIGRPADPRQARKLWLKAAEAGSPEAKRRLALIALSDGTTRKNSAQGLKWLREAAELGDPEAQYEWALLLDEGDGVRRDRGEALHYFRKAAAAGHAAAQNDLGVLLFDEGTPAARSEAWAWLKRSSDNGYESARENLERLERQMGFRERRAARKLLEESEVPEDAP